MRDVWEHESDGLTERWIDKAVPEWVSRGETSGWMCEYMVGRKGKMTHGWVGRWKDGQPCLEPVGAVPAPPAYDLAPCNLCQGLPSQATPGGPPDHAGLWQPGVLACVHLCSVLGGRAGCEGGDTALIHTSRTICWSLRDGAVTIPHSLVSPHKCMFCCHGQGCFCSWGVRSAPPESLPPVYFHLWFL